MRDKLRTSRAEFIRAGSRMQTASEVLDGFPQEYLQEGPEFAGNTRKELRTRGRLKPLTAPSTTVERTFSCRAVQWSWRERNSPDFS